MKQLLSIPAPDLHGMGVLVKSQGDQYFVIVSQEIFKKNPIKITSLSGKKKSDRILSTGDHLFILDDLVLAANMAFDIHDDYDCGYKVPEELPQQVFVGP